MFWANIQGPQKFLVKEHVLIWKKREITFLIGNFHGLDFYIVIFALDSIFRVFEVMGLRWVIKLIKTAFPWKVGFQLKNWLAGFCKNYEFFCFVFYHIWNEYVYFSGNLLNQFVFLLILTLSGILQKMLQNTIKHGLLRISSTLHEKCWYSEFF